MKKFLLLLVPGMLLLAQKAEAQFQKGTVHWGATISADGAATKSKAAAMDAGKSAGHDISPSVQMGWFTRDNRMFGLRLNSTLALRNWEIQPSGPMSRFANNNYSLRLSPFIRQYKTITPKWALFLQSGLEGSYIWSVAKMDDYSEKEHGYGVGLYVLPGITYRISSRFAIESDLQLLSLRIGYTHFAKSDDFNFNAGITSGIGNYFGVRAAWYLQKSK